jgi:PAS domain S-box-containing protein
MSSNRDPDYVVDTLPLPAFAFDMNTLKFIAINKEFERLLGYSAAELRELTIEDIRPRSDLALLRRALAQTPPEGAVEWVYRRKDGSLIKVQIRYRESSAVLGGKSTPIRFVFVTGCGDEPTPPASEVFGSK